MSFLTEKEFEINNRRIIKSKLINDYLSEKASNNYKLNMQNPEKDTEKIVENESISCVIEFIKTISKSCLRVLDSNDTSLLTKSFKINDIQLVDGIILKFENQKDKKKSDVKESKSSDITDNVSSSYTQDYNQATTKPTTNLSTLQNNDLKTSKSKNQNPSCFELEMIKELIKEDPTSFFNQSIFGSSIFARSLDLIDNIKFKSALVPVLLSRFIKDQEALEFLMANHHNKNNMFMEIDCILKNFLPSTIERCDLSMESDENLSLIVGNKEKLYLVEMKKNSYNNVVKLNNDFKLQIAKYKLLKEIINYIFPYKYEIKIILLSGEKLDASQLKELKEKIIIDSAYVAEEIDYYQLKTFTSPKLENLACLENNIVLNNLNNYILPYNKEALDKYGEIDEDDKVEFSSLSKCLNNLLKGKFKQLKIDSNLQDNKEKKIFYSKVLMIREIINSNVNNISDSNN